MWHILLISWVLVYNCVVYYIYCIFCYSEIHNSLPIQYFGLFILVSEPHPILPFSSFTMSSSTTANTGTNSSQHSENQSPFPSKPLTTILSQLCSIKMDKTNFLLWESSILRSSKVIILKVSSSEQNHAQRNL